ncbi:MAG: PH domain-containing protein, partial [Ruminococcus sp.]|nr:PH domain-containing protein [Ruminococcus sp.]
TIAILRWVFIFFEMDPKTITSHTGYFGLVRTTLAFCDVSTVAVHQSSFQRIFGACTLYIDTTAASLSHTDISLVLPKKRADHILDFIASESGGEVKYTVDSKKRSQLAFSLLFSSTFSGVIIFAGILFETSRIIDRNIEIALLNTAAGEISKFTSNIPFIIVVSALIMIGGWLLSFFANLMRYWHFSVTRQGSRLYVKSGIWTLRRDVMACKCINFLDITSSLLMKIFKICTINLNCAGYGDRKSEIPTIAPITSQKDLEETIEHLLPGMYGGGVTLRTGRRDIRRFLSIPVGLFALVPIIRFIATRIFPHWISEINVLSFIISVPFVWFIIVKAAATQHTGIGFNDTHCVLEYCSFYRFHRVVVERQNITSVAVLQSWPQKREGYCSIAICTSNEKIKTHLIKHLPLDAAMSILRTNALAV